MKKTIIWKGYPLKKFFEIKTTKSFDKKNFIFIKNGECDFIGRTSINNGIQGKLNKFNIEPNQANCFSLIQIGENVTIWRERPWYASQNIFQLIPQEDIIKKVHLFIKTSIDKSLTVYGKNVYTSYPTLKSLLNLFIKLPSITPPRLGIYGRNYPYYFLRRCH